MIAPQCIKDLCKMVGLALALATAVVFCLAISTGFIRAEPGDNYPFEIQRRGPLTLNKAAGASLPDRPASGRLFSFDGRPSECPRRAWCGCWLANKLGLHDRSLWVARNWARVGRAAKRGCVGCVAVLRRGHGGHVGLVEGYDGINPIIKSGNHNNAVGVGVYPASRVIAYRTL